jgi:GPH family glycoside/pentoside/hexuronide:cation symporter
MVKFGLAFAGLLSGFILGVIGFDQSVAMQTDSTLAQLRLAFIGVPVAGTLIALWAMRDYALDEQAVGEIKEALAQRRTTSISDRDEKASQREEEWVLQP